MKKIITILVMLVIMLVVGCSETAKVDSEPVSSDSKHKWDNWPYDIDHAHGLGDNAIIFWEKRFY